MLKRINHTPARPRRAKTRPFPSKAAGEKKRGGVPSGTLRVFSSRERIGDLFQHPLLASEMDTHSELPVDRFIPAHLWIEFPLIQRRQARDSQLSVLARL
jgi:hypothetical protein